MWRWGETDGGSLGKRAGWKTERWRRWRAELRRMKGGLVVRVSLMKHSWQCKPTALSWQASPHQPVDIIIQPSKGPGPHTHSWPAALRCTASVCELWFRKCLFMLLQSGTYTHTHQLIKHYSSYTSCCYVLWLQASLPLDTGHTSSNQIIQIQFLVKLACACTSPQECLLYLKLGIVLQMEYCYFVGCQVCSPLVSYNLFSSLPPSLL